MIISIVSLYLTTLRGTYSSSGTNFNILFSDSSTEKYGDFFYTMKFIFYIYAFWPQWFHLVNLNYHVHTLN